MSTTPRRIGKYELQKLLGSGSAGEVWQSYDLQYRRKVAIKIFHTNLQSDPNFMKRLLSDGQTIASLHHPNIVQILDANIVRPKEANSTTAYLVMDYIDGPTLAEAIRNTSRRGAFPPVSEIVSLFTHLAAALDYAHEHGIVHGNIKPTNILLSLPMLEEAGRGHPVAWTGPAPAYGEPMLTDFSIVRPANSSTGSSVLYISPEQAKGLPLTRRSDIYSLGVILYEICTGVTPFRSESPVVLMMQHINMLPTSPMSINTNIPSELSTVILRALAKDSAARFATASQLAAALADACAVATELNTPTVVAKEPALMLSRGRADLSASTLLGVSFLPLYATQSSEPGPSQPSRVTRPLTTIPYVSTTQAQVATSTPTPGGASLHGESVQERETPPAMAAIPSSRLSFPLTRPSSIPLPPLLLPPPKKVKKLPAIYPWLALTLLLVIIGSVLGTLSWLHSQSQQATSSSTVVGHVFFQDDAFGHNDVLRIEMQNISDPAPGKSYDAWLLSESSAAPVLLGELSVNAGQVHFLYPGNAQHSDLLASMSRLLITEEDANGTPGFPSSKQVYVADFAQASVLIHLRDLLSGEQQLNKLGVTGGLALWLLRDTSKSWLWASNARDYWQGSNTDRNTLNFIRGQIVHILDVLEGKQIDTRDASIARVGAFEANAVAPDYLDASLSHLTAIAQSAYATAEQKALADTIQAELQQVKTWLQNVEADAIKLLNMTDVQFTQPQTQSLLDDMVMQTNYAYNGQSGLSANSSHQVGMAQIYADIQRLATFEINVIP